VPKHILDYSKVAAAVEWKLTQVSELPSVMAGSDCCCIIALGTVRIVDFQTAHVFIFEITPLYLNRITVTFVWNITPLRDRLTCVVHSVESYHICIVKQSTYIYLPTVDSAVHVQRLGSRGVKLFYGFNTEEWRVMGCGVTTHISSFIKPQNSTTLVSQVIVTS
jgi:hypothetical protein